MVIIRTGTKPLHGHLPGTCTSRPDATYRGHIYLTYDRLTAVFGPPDDPDTLAWAVAIRRPAGKPVHAILRADNPAFPPAAHPARTAQWEITTTARAALGDADPFPVIVDAIREPALSGAAG